MVRYRACIESLQRSRTSFHLIDFALRCEEAQTRSCLLARCNLHAQHLSAGGWHLEAGDWLTKFPTSAVIVVKVAPAGDRVKAFSDWNSSHFARLRGGLGDKTVCNWNDPDSPSTAIYLDCKAAEEFCLSSGGLDIGCSKKAEDLGSIGEIEVLKTALQGLKLCHFRPIQVRISEA